MYDNHGTYMMYYAAFCGNMQITYTLKQHIH